MFKPLIMLFALLSITNTSAKTLHFSSGDSQVYLLELYSSQGCSSCPPAQNWINQLQDSPELWNQVVPVVFHVDYWDYLGWKDPFAKSQFSFRQRAQRREGNVKSVYTPGFVVNGKEWKGWFQRRGLNLTESHAGTLDFTLEKQPGNKSTFTATYINPTDVAFRDLKLNVALLVMDHKTKVKAGENRSKELEESFIVLDLLSFNSQQHKTQPGKSDSKKAIIFQDSMSLKRAVKAVAIWVSDKNSLHPVQATGGYL